ncbi:MAG: ABC transporter permease [Candidatus Limnocylindria bacterium]
MRALRRNLPAIVVFFAALVLWEVVISSLDVRAFILPAPSSIANALVENWEVGYQIWPAAQTTFLEAAGGMVIGTVLGVLIALVISRWTLAGDIALPVAVAISAIPIIAFAPIANNWFGVLSPTSKMVIAAVLVFFPIMINVLRGLTEVPNSSLELMRSYAAGSIAVFRKVRVPNALPFFLTGMKVGTTLALIGAVVGEYFGGLNVALGRIVVQSASRLSFEVTWAAIIVASVVGIAMYLLIVGIERIAIPWHPAVRGERIG